MYPASRSTLRTFPRRHELLQHRALAAQQAKDRRRMRPPGVKGMKGTGVGNNKKRRQIDTSYLIGTMTEQEMMEMIIPESIDADADDGQHEFDDYDEEGDDQIEEEEEEKVDDDVTEMLEAQQRLALLQAQQQQLGKVIIPRHQDPRNSNSLAASHSTGGSFHISYSTTDRLPVSNGIYTRQTGEIVQPSLPLLGFTKATTNSTAAQMKGMKGSVSSPSLLASSSSSSSSTTSSAAGTSSLTKSASKENFITLSSAEETDRLNARILSSIDSQKLKTYLLVDDVIQKRLVKKIERERHVWKERERWKRMESVREIQAAESSDVNGTTMAETTVAPSVTAVAAASLRVTSRPTSSPSLSASASTPILTLNKSSTFSSSSSSSSSSQPNGTGIWSSLGVDYTEHGIPDLALPELNRQNIPIKELTKSKVWKNVLTGGQQKDSAASVNRPSSSTSHLTTTATTNHSSSENTHSSKKYEHLLELFHEYQHRMIKSKKRDGQDGEPRMAYSGVLSGGGSGSGGGTNTSGQSLTTIQSGPNIVWEFHSDPSVNAILAGGGGGNSSTSSSLAHSSSSSTITEIGHNPANQSLLSRLYQTQHQGRFGTPPDSSSGNNEEKQHHHSHSHSHSHHHHHHSHMPRRSSDAPLSTVEKIEALKPGLYLKQQQQQQNQLLQQQQQQQQTPLQQQQAEDNQEEEKEQDAQQYLRSPKLTLQTSASVPSLHATSSNTNSHTTSNPPKSRPYMSSTSYKLHNLTLSSLPEGHPAHVHANVDPRRGGGGGGGNEATSGATAPAKRMNYSQSTGVLRKGTQLDDSIVPPSSTMFTPTTAGTRHTPVAAQTASNHRIAPLSKHSIIYGHGMVLTPDHPDYLRRKQEQYELAIQRMLKKKAKEEKEKEVKEQVRKQIEETRLEHLHRWRDGFDGTKQRLDRQLITRLVERAESRNAALLQTSAMRRGEDETQSAANKSVEDEKEAVATVAPSSISNEGRSSTSQSLRSPSLTKQSRATSPTKDPPPAPAPYRPLMRTTTHDSPWQIVQDGESSSNSNNESVLNTERSTSFPIVLTRHTSIESAGISSQVTQRQSNSNRGSVSVPAAANIQQTQVEEEEESTKHELTFTVSVSH